ncbi:MAG: hypothetical protein ACX939_02060 [Hyphococcus sp.]
MTRSILALCAVALASAACASSKPDPQRQAGPADGLRQPGRLLAMARSIEGDKGCAKAVPTYRVVSSFGDGYDVAQYELGACLLTLQGESETEAQLFHQEAAFWLRRAAWAGNARAQRALAQALSGASTDHAGKITAAPEEAMGWAIVYRENPARDLYDLPDVSPLIITHLTASLDDAGMRQAEAFAESFEPVVMASFVMPQGQRENAQRPQGAQRARPTGRRRPR